MLSMLSGLPTPATSYIERRVRTEPEAAGAALDAYVQRVRAHALHAPTISIAGTTLTVDRVEVRDGRRAEPIRIVSGWFRFGGFRSAAVELELSAWSLTMSALGMRMARRRGGLNVSRSPAYQLAACELVERLARRLELESTATITMTYSPSAAWGTGFARAPS
jgi:hypothetical protein